MPEAMSALAKRGFDKLIALKPKGVSDRSWIDQNKDLFQLLSGIPSFVREYDSVMTKFEELNNEVMKIKESFKYKIDNLEQNLRDKGMFNPCAYSTRDYTPSKNHNFVQGEDEQCQNQPHSDADRSGYEEYSDINPFMVNQNFMMQNSAVPQQQPECFIKFRVTVFGQTRIYDNLDEVPDSFKDNAELIMVPNPNFQNGFGNDTMVSSFSFNYDPNVIDPQQFTPLMSEEELKRIVDICIGNNTQNQGTQGGTHRIRKPWDYD